MNVDIVWFHHPLGLGNRKKFWMELLVNREDRVVTRLEARQMASIGIHKRHHTVLRHGFLRLKTRGNKTRDMEGRKETGVTIHHDDWWTVCVCCGRDISNVSCISDRKRKRRNSIPLQPCNDGIENAFLSLSLCVQHTSFKAPVDIINGTASLSSLSNRTGGASDSEPSLSISLFFNPPILFIYFLLEITPKKVFPTERNATTWPSSSSTTGLDWCSSVIRETMGVGGPHRRSQNDKENGTDSNIKKIESKAFPVVFKRPFQLSTGEKTRELCQLGW